MLPFTPMSPIIVDKIPSGNEWGHQLKWDGYRIIAWINEGKVELYTKNMLSKNSKFPELVHALSKLNGTLMLDGEAIILDPATTRPSFHKIHQLDKKNRSVQKGKPGDGERVQYIVFDLLQFGEQDLRNYPFIERHHKLQELAAGWSHPLYMTELFMDGEVLWRWVVNNSWEGIVSKRLSSLYKVGKEHKDWFKRKLRLQLNVEIVGILKKEGRISSLVMRKDGLYVGRASSGLNESIKSILRQLPAELSSTDYFNPLPEGLRGEIVAWLNDPFHIEVTGRELTEGGLVRHSHIVSMELKSQ
jgi:bifunctional non-homologous end joining protein LigD